jgi:hypothetical protein
MRFCLRRLQPVLVGLIACVTLLPAALAQNAGSDQSQNATTPTTPPATPKTAGPSLTQFGSDITVEPNQQVADVTCFGCSVRIRGQVNGDVTVFAGGITLEEEGEVAGDVTNFGRGVRLDKSTKVGGDVTAFGGGVRRDADASVGGDVTNFKGPIWMFLIFGLPILVLAGITLFIVWLVRRLTRPSVPLTA